MFTFSFWTCNVDNRSSVQSINHLLLLCLVIWLHYARPGRWRWGPPTGTQLKSYRHICSSNAHSCRSFGHEEKGGEWDFIIRVILIQFIVILFLRFGVTAFEGNFFFNWFSVIVRKISSYRDGSMKNANPLIAHQASSFNRRNQSICACGCMSSLIKKKWVFSNGLASLHL